LVGHNIILYDIPVIRKVLGVSLDCIMIDTLALSWYLYPTLKIHGLEVWGEKLGVKTSYCRLGKPILADYIHRCLTDVVINKTI
jgi:DNA polymerase III alpha subunit (gram-positive type)